MIKLFASDLDGTLLNHDFAINKENIDAIHKLKLHGITFVVATGRIFADVYTICSSHGLFPYIISSNGACIFNPDKEQIYGKEICPDDVKDIVHFMKEQKLCYGIGTNMTFDVSHHWETVLDNELVRLHNAGIHIEKSKSEFAKHELMSQNGVRELTHLPSDETCYSISMLTFDDGAIQRLKNFLKNYHNLTYTVAGPHNVEIMRTEGDKGISLAYLCKVLHMNMEDTAAIGDSLNDILMIQKAGIGIAIGNARAEVKAVSDFIAKNCLDNGVAHAIDMVLSK